MCAPSCCSGPQGNAILSTLVAIGAIALIVAEANTIITLLAWVALCLAVGFLGAFGLVYWASKHQRVWASEPGYEFHPRPASWRADIIHPEGSVPIALTRGGQDGVVRGLDSGQVASLPQGHTYSPAGVIETPAGSLVRVRHWVHGRPVSGRR